MNALVGQEAKANFYPLRRVGERGADDGGSKDGGDFRRAGSGVHLGGGWQFEVLQDGSKE